MWFWVNSSFARTTMDVCLRVPKESTRSRFNSYWVSGTVYWSYPISPFGIVASTFFPTTFLKRAVYTQTDLNRIRKETIRKPFSLINGWIRVLMRKQICGKFQVALYFLTIRRLFCLDIEEKCIFIQCYTFKKDNFSGFPIRYSFKAL